MAISFALIVLLFLGTGVLGLILLRRGLRGRRIGDHPICRKCGFDLFGLPEDRKVCPECGTDLSAHNAVLIGHRQRRPGMIWGGAVMLVLFLTAVGLVSVNVIADIKWVQLKPFEWVAWEARRGDTVAWAELTRRAKAGEMSPERAQALTNDALAWQKDLTRIWKIEVGDFVEQSRAAKLITDEQWTTFARQAPQLSLAWRSKVSPTVTWLPGKVVIGASRSGSSSRLSVRSESPVETDDPLAVKRRLGGGSSESTLSGLGGGGWMGISIELDPKAVAAATPGKRTTTVRIKTSVRENWQTTVSEWSEKLSADWELVPKDESTVELVPDDSPQVRKQVEAAMKVDKLEVHPQQAGNNLQLSLKIGAIPLPLAFDIVARAADGREWKISPISSSGPTQYSTGGFVMAKDKFDAKVVDLIFRPSPGTAESSVDITRMWNGEITIHDVPVTWPATQPTTK